MPLMLSQSSNASGEKEFDNSDQLHNVPPNSTLDIDLELVSFKPVIDVTGDSKVLKKILREGEGAFTANEGAAVTVSYAARLEDGTVFEKKGLDGEQPMNFVTDEEQVIAGLDRASATMRKGELAMVTINHEYGFGRVEVERDLAIVPPCSNLIYEVEMLDFVKERAPWEMNNRERIEEAGRKKEEGNLLFKAGKFRQAGKKYDKAADYVSEDDSFEDDEQKLVKALRVACWLNAAACSLKLNDFQEAIKLSSKVLDYEFYNVKALYRRAQAYMEIGDLVLAELDIRKALDIDPVNREVKILERSLKQLQTESNRRDAKVYSNMFARMTMDTSLAIKKPKVEKPEKSKDDEVSLVAMDMEKTADSSIPVETRTV
ncbi:Peptidylprolyl isomerase [Psidium guajava]|nr:Peptidylprolyl isomerase [Psidium guajava]